MLVGMGLVVPPFLIHVICDSGSLPAVHEPVRLHEARWRGAD